MKIQKLLIALTAANFALLVLQLAQGVSASPDIPLVLRGRALEIVDAQGRVRASLGILPATSAEQASSGQAAPETVILRLMNTRGRPAVKVSTSDEGSGVSLTGSAASRETYVTVGSSGESAYVRLHNENGREHVLKP